MTEKNKLSHRAMQSRSWKLYLANAGFLDSIVSSRNLAHKDTMPQPYTIGITGGSGSGKTYFHKGTSSHFRPEEICLISQDHYYKPLEAQFTDSKGVQNFDLPDIDR